MLRYEGPPQDLPGLVRSRGAYENGAKHKAYLNADAHAKHSDVKAALGAIRAAGIQEVALRVEEPSVQNP